jgi:antitoxin component YwqK of YwqJK toxin-antitoxin module
MNTVKWLALIFILSICSCRIRKIDNVDKIVLLYDNGKPREITTGYYKDGKFVKNGLRTIYYSGLKMHEIYYEENLPIKCTSWYPNGLIQSESFKNNDEKYEVIYSMDSENEKVLTRRYKNGMPWEGVFIVEEAVSRNDYDKDELGEREYISRHDHPRTAKHIYKDGELISNTDPAITSYSITLNPPGILRQ